MNRAQFYDYILENFSIDGPAARLIHNILHYIECNFEEAKEQQKYAEFLLSGIGLTSEEIKKINFIEEEKK